MRLPAPAARSSPAHVTGRRVRRTVAPSGAVLAPAGAGRTWALGREGFDTATYIAGGDGLDFRSDLGTLNLSDVPTVMAELGNMRSRRDARVMTSRHGQHRYVLALAAGARRFLGR